MSEERPTGPISGIGPSSIKKEGPGFEMNKVEQPKSERELPKEEQIEQPGEPMDLSHAEAEAEIPDIRMMADERKEDLWDVYERMNLPEGVLAERELGYRTREHPVIEAIGKPRLHQPIEKSERDEKGRWKKEIIRTPEEEAFSSGEVKEFLVRLWTGEMLELEKKEVGRQDGPNEWEIGGITRAMNNIAEETRAELRAGRVDSLVKNEDEEEYLPKGSPLIKARKVYKRQKLEGLSDEQYMMLPEVKQVQALDELADFNTAQLDLTKAYKDILYANPVEANAANQLLDDWKNLVVTMDFAEAWQSGPVSERQRVPEGKEVARPLGEMVDEAMRWEVAIAKVSDSVPGKREDDKYGLDKVDREVITPKMEEFMRKMLTVRRGEVVEGEDRRVEYMLNRFAVKQKPGDLDYVDQFVKESTRQELWRAFKEQAPDLEERKEKVRRVLEGWKSGEHVRRETVENDALDFAQAVAVRDMRIMTKDWQLATAWSFEPLTRGSLHKTWVEVGKKKFVIKKVKPDYEDKESREKMKEEDERIKELNEQLLDLESLDPDAMGGVEEYNSEKHGGLKKAEILTLLDGREVVPDELIEMAPASSAATVLTRARLRLEEDIEKKWDYGSAVIAEAVERGFVPETWIRDYFQSAKASVRVGEELKTLTFEQMWWGYEDEDGEVREGNKRLGELPIYSKDVSQDQVRRNEHVKIMINRWGAYNMLEMMKNRDTREFEKFLTDLAERDMKKFKLLGLAFPGEPGNKRLTQQVFATIMAAQVAYYFNYTKQKIGMRARQLRRDLTSAGIGGEKESLEAVFEKILSDDSILNDYGKRVFKALIESVEKFSVGDFYSGSELRGKWKQIKPLE